MSVAPPIRMNSAPSSSAIPTNGLSTLRPELDVFRAWQHEMDNQNEDKDSNEEAQTSR